MPVLAGIDEAGYGPLLGPLVMTAVAFESEGLDGASDLWDVLAKGVTRKATRSDKRLLVADSKKAYSKTTGLKRLEETALSFLIAGGHGAESLNALMSVVCPAHGSIRRAYPWYANDDVALPVDASRDRIDQKVGLVRDCLGESGVRFGGVESCVLCAAEFNACVRRTGNKSVVLFEQAAHLLHSLWERFAADGLFVFVDKQGGRNDYLPYLAPEFMGKAIRVRKEGMNRSIYEIRQGDARMEVHFVMKGEDHHFPTALASMYSKYLRELHLRLFNRYWQREVPSLKETAGYVTDGRRFLKDIEAARQRLGIDLDLMARMK